jgi:hypothetical protein
MYLGLITITRMRPIERGVIHLAASDPNESMHRVESACTVRERGLR